MIKQTLVSETAGRVAYLPFGVVEIMIRSPHRESRLRSRRRFRIDPQHAIKWSHTLKIENVAITHGQQDVPRGAQCVKRQRCLSVDRPDLKNALNRQRANQALPVRAPGIALIEIIGCPHAFAATRVSEQARMTEVDFAHEIIEVGWRSFGARIPLTEFLQMAQHQTPSRQVQSAINENARRGVDAAVRIDRDHDEAKTRQTLCQVTVSGVTRHGNKAGWTGAGKGVLNVDIKMLCRPRQTTTGGVVAMQQNQE